MSELQPLQRALIATRKRAAAGCDDITNHALKNLDPAALPLLISEYNKTWQSEQVPDACKISIVCPVLKAGKSPTSVTSYRPISLTTSVGKLMEGLEHHGLIWLLEQHHILPLWHPLWMRNR